MAKLTLKLEFEVPDAPWAVERLNEVAAGVKKAAQDWDDATEGSVLRSWMFLETP